MKNNLFSAIVIGSKDHPLAEKCIDWGDDFYVGDYDLLIFNLPNLDQKTFSQINNDNKNYFINLRNKIVEAQEKTDLIVICIADKLLVDEYIKLDGNKNITNYSWSPIIPFFEENAGDKIPQQEKSLKIKYLNLVKKWDQLFENKFNNTGYDNGNDWSYSFKIDKKTYLKNTLGKDIAFGLGWSVSVNGSYRTGSKKPIIFLPKIENVKEGIDLLLEDFVLNDEPEPTWLQEVEIVGEKDISIKVEEDNEKIRTIQEGIDKLNEKLNKLNKYKKLLYLKGKPLEKIVEECLGILGVKLKELEVDNLEDRIFEYDNFSIPFEVRGKNTNGLNEKDLAQLIKRIADREKGEKYSTRGVFVINHQKDLKPDDRGEVCNVNIIKQAEAFNLCILPTIEIFSLLNRSLSGEKIDIKEILFNTSGLFRAEDIKKDAPKLEHTVE